MGKWKSTVPGNIHFVWIGLFSNLNTGYIKIWMDVNRDKSFYLWLDKGSTCCTEFHKSIEKYISKNSKTPIESLIALKNEAFEYIYPKVLEGYEFNTLALDFLNKKNIPFEQDKTSQRNIFSCFKYVEIKDITPIFTDQFLMLKKYYYYELILRGNLASASDIVRLIILYKYGGVYIDVDTLPDLDSVFRHTNQYLISNRIVDNQYISLSKTKLALQVLNCKFTNIQNGCDYLDDCLHLSYHEKTEIRKNIFFDLYDFNLKKIPPLGKVFAYENLLALGSIKRLKGIYYNNVIASHPGSKSIRIILCSIKKRYRFIEKHNAIFSLYEGNAPHHYLSRLLGWRDESRQKISITPILTGPGLIVEVMLGLAYELVEFDNNVTPGDIANYFQNEDFGIAFFRHTLDTPDGLVSSWRS
ncbi:TPA: TcdA/TcdB catalytic glycosyltransferase domain-containing protein [Enterobacter asburiae]|uniref:TcdA/TcdB catalytic glycosyltransferase domain-containing protein n=1 Tax=Enterobacter asburiae TaxID=61645 RepID=UPI002966FBF9|nr:TcdA/TcdB catalytic glycosyltransferase domain-containing protein [Enterobacter asburiae]MDW3573231.1 glycosyltransferase [Enterobacter asburiae]